MPRDKHETRSRSRSPRRNDRDRERHERERDEMNPRRRDRRSRSRSVHSDKRRSRSRSPARKRRRGSGSRSRSKDGRQEERSKSRSKERAGERREGRKRDRSESSSSSDEDRRRKEKRRDKDKEGKRSKSKERRREKKREKREKKEKKKRGGGANAPQWGKYGTISDIDIFTKGPEFHTWLVEERKINPETISKDQQKKEFSRFVEDYNTATLPHEKYYNMESYDRRMSALRQGEYLPPADDSYDPEADMKALSGAHKKKAVEHESYMSKEQLMELRRVQHERIEAGKMKLLGMDVKQNMGVRMDGTMFDG